MSSASRQFYRAFARLAQCPPSKRQCVAARQRRQLHATSARPFSTNTYRFAAPPSNTTRRLNADTADQDEPSDFTLDELQTPAEPLTPADLDPETRANYDTMQPADQQKYMAVQNHMKALFEQESVTPELEEEMDRMVKNVGYELDKEMGPIQFRPDWTQRELVSGLWSMDEDDELGRVPDYDDEFDESMITSVAESELEVHREMREYQRIAAWELPFLSKFARPFQLPDVNKTPLRFRYTTYLGEGHPAGKKVVCEFTTTDIAAAASLTEPQRVKLQKLLGNRYNPDTDLARMSSEKFAEPAQNKRYLGDLINSLIKEAKDAQDMFEDIPVDRRHVKPKRPDFEAMFPESWKVDSDGQSTKNILEHRETLRIAAAPNKETGMKRQIVDGRAIVDDYVRTREMAPVVAPRQRL